MAVDSANTLDVEAIQTVKDSVADAIRNKPHLQMYCSDDCILRFLRARHMDPQKASRMLTETLHWYATDMFSCSMNSAFPVRRAYRARPWCFVVCVDLLGVDDGSSHARVFCLDKLQMERSMQA